MEIEIACPEIDIPELNVFIPSANEVVKSCATVEELIDYLSKFPKSMKVCGVGGGDVTVDWIEEYPDRLWFE